MGMLKKADSPKKLLNTNLTRGAKVSVNSTVNRLEFIEELDKSTPAPKPVAKTVRVSIKVDNHTRNKLSALVTLGVGDSIGSIVQDLVHDRIDRLNRSDHDRYIFIYDMLEQREK